MAGAVSARGSVPRLFEEGHFCSCGTACHKGSTPAQPSRVTPYSQGVKANVVFFQKGPPTENVWIFDGRANVPGVTKKSRPLTAQHFVEFESCYGIDPNGRSKRTDQGETGRFRKFHISEVKERGYKLDITWLKDDSLEDADDLPEPEVLAAEAITELEAAVDGLREILAMIEANGSDTRLDTIPAILKRFRMSVLAAASEGRIVGLGPDELGASCKFGDVLREMRNGISRKPGFEPPGIPILRISAVRTGTVELSDVRYLSEPTDKERQFSLENGDLLFTRYNGNLDLVGVCGVVRGLLDGQSVLYPDKLIRVRVSDSVLPEWVEIFLSAPGSREMIMSQSKSSAGQNGISGTDIKLLPFIVPSIEIQTKIVKRVRVMFEQADAIEARYRKAQAFTDKLMPSVLAKAFRGELVEQGAEEIQHG